MKIQEWYCQLCEIRGEIEFDNQEDVYSVMMKVKDNHSELSPDCKQPIEKIMAIYDVRRYDNG